MQMSRHLESTEKTKFRKGREEEFKKSGKKPKQKNKHQSEHRAGFDMWEDGADGC